MGFLSIGGGLGPFRARIGTGGVSGGIGPVSAGTGWGGRDGPRSDLIGWILAGLVFAFWPYLVVAMVVSRAGGSDAAVISLGIIATGIWWTAVLALTVRKYNRQQRALEDSGLPAEPARTIRWRALAGSILGTYLVLVGLNWAWMSVFEDKGHPALMLPISAAILAGGSWLARQSWARRFNVALADTKSMGTEPDEDAIEPGYHDEMAEPAISPVAPVPRRSPPATRDQAEVDETTLKQLVSWFPETDIISGNAAMTSFKQALRAHQSAMRILAGEPVGTSSRPGGESPNGSKLASHEPLADDFRNFLSDRVIAAVRHRTSYSEASQTLNQRRLRSDLLSSMPMAFNLFGDLHDDPARLTAFGSRVLGLNLPGREIKFEHSPSRHAARYTNDGTAFDLMMSFGRDQQDQTVVGVETKYHEHALTEPTPAGEKLAHYLRVAALAEQAGVFASGWEQAVLGTNLQQIWRDHLLMLSMLHNPFPGEFSEHLWTKGVYVLAYPEENVVFADVARRYRGVLADPSSFVAITIEDLLDFHVLHDAAAERNFRIRYGLAEGGSTGAEVRADAREQALALLASGA